MNNELEYEELCVSYLYLIEIQDTECTLVILHTKNWNYIFGKKLLVYDRNTRCHIIKKVNLVIFVEGDPKAPFSIATTPRCRGGLYSVSRIAPLYPWSSLYNAEC